MTASVAHHNVDRIDLMMHILLHSVCIQYNQTEIDAGTVSSSRLAVDKVFLTFVVMTHLLSSLKVTSFLTILVIHFIAITSKNNPSKF